MIPSEVRKFLLKEKEGQGFFCVAIDPQLHIIQYYGQATVFGITPPKYYLSIQSFLPGLATETFESDFEIPFYNISEKHVCNVYFLKSQKTSFLILIDKSEIFNVTQKYQQFAHDDNISKNKFKRMALELKKAQKKLKQSNQEKATLIAMLSHELGTPLTSIVGYSELLLNNHSNPKKGLQIINRNAHYLKHMIENTLLFGRSEASGIPCKIEQISLQNLFNVLKATMLPAANNKKLKLQMFYKGDEKVNIDITRTKQILINLLNNAIKYTESGSVELKFSLIGKNYVFSIVDTGLGVAEELKKDIFNPWKRIEDNSEKGAGIGLYISQKLALAIDGTLKLKYSKPGLGSIFQLLLPVQNPSNNIDEVTVAKINFRNKAILIIDDDYDIIELIEAMLSSSNLQIHTATSFSKAQNILQNTKIDIVLTDLNLGRVKASSFIALIKQNHPQLSVLLMSALPTTSLRAKYKALGFDDVVSKPLDFNTLLKTIFAALN